MSIALVCPECKTRLRVAALSADTKELKCPKCGGRVPVHAPGARSSQQRYAAAVTQQSKAPELEAMETRISEVPSTKDDADALATRISKPSELVPSEPDSISGQGTVLSRTADSSADDDWLTSAESGDEVNRLTRRPGSGDRQAWRQGLKLHYAGACVLIVAFGAVLFAFLVGILIQMPRAIGAFVMIAGVLLFVHHVLAFMGQTQCCAAPTRRGARTLARAGVLLSGLCLILFPVDVFVGGLATPIWLVTELVRAVVFFLFGRACAQIAGDRALASSFRKLLIACCGAQLLAVMVVVVAGVFHVSKPASIAQLYLNDPLLAVRQTGLPLALAGVVVMMMELALFAWFVRNLVRLQEALDGYMGRRRGGEAILWKALLGGMTVLFIVEVLFVVVMSATGGPVEAPRSMERQVLPRPK